MDISKSDTRALAHHFEQFLELLTDPEKYFKKHPEELPNKDMQLIGAALYFLGDCYLRGKGYKVHPRSKTAGSAMDAFTDMYDAICDEVEDRPYLYPLLKGALGRTEAAVEIDWLTMGTSKWGEVEEDPTEE